jgi:poly-gamma-glutamate capsule biosynthesis protein CapA/YwtB (metallophosphatase superfamily)
LAIVLIFSLVVYPGLVSSWRSSHLNVKGINECGEGNLSKGEDAFRKAVSLNPDNAAAHYNLALVLLSADDDTAGAAKHLAEVIRLEPGCAVAYHNLGVIELFYRRETVLALENLRRAAALNPECASTHLALGYLYEYSGEYGKAKEEYSLCVSADPGGPLSTDAEAALKALESAPLVDDLAEKLSYEETVYEIVVAGDVYPSDPSEADNSAFSPLRFSAPVFDKALLAAACLAAPAEGETKPASAGVPGNNPHAGTIISNSGIDVFGVLPNEAAGFGPDVFGDTVGALEDEGIAFTGFGYDLKSAIKPARIVTEEVNVNVLAFNGASPTGGAGEETGLMSAPLSVGTAVPAVSAATDADIVIVLFRWAEPLLDAPTSEMISLAHAVVDAGADVVVGVGTEAILPVEIYGDGVIAYGLPDLLPPADRKPYSYTRLLAVQYSPESGVLGYRFVPIYVENKTPDFSDGPEGNLIDFRLIKRVPVVR